MKRQNNKMPHDVLHITGIGGSLRNNSYSYLALRYAMTLFEQRGCRTYTVDLRTAGLPFCNASEPACPAVIDFRSQVSHSHAVVFCSPEYHGSISGLLKNALDLLAMEHLKGKIVGVISVLGGPPNNNALNDIGRIMRACHAWVMPQHVAISRPETTFQDGQLRDSALEKRFEEFADNLIVAASRFCEVMPNKEPQEDGDESINNFLRRNGRSGEHIDSLCASDRRAAQGASRQLV